MRLVLPLSNRLERTMLLLKAHIHSHARRLKSGKVVQVTEHDDKRTKATCAEPHCHAEATEKVFHVRMCAEHAKTVRERHKEQFEHLGEEGFQPRTKYSESRVLFMAQ